MVTVQEYLDKVLNQTDGAWYGGYVNMLKTLESAFPSPKHWILEYIQNAEDAGSSKLSITLNEESIQILNNGQAFTDENFQAVCDVNSRKMPSLGFKGYIGIGFKSIFRLTDRVDIHSGRYHFSFNRNYWNDAMRKRVSINRWPWEILPVAVEPIEPPDGFTTCFLVPIKDSRSQEGIREITDFLSGNDLPKEMVLLLNNIKKIEIQTPVVSYEISKQTEVTRTYRIDNQEVIEDKVVIKKQIIGGRYPEEAKYLVLRRNVTVPDDISQDRETERVRRSDVTKREIGLVFSLDAQENIRNLRGKLSGVYSFLPVEGEQTGLPFGIFGDFIPSIGRDLINYGITWNHWMCRELVDFIKLVVAGVFFDDEQWRFYPADMLTGISRTYGPGGDFWNTRLVEPVESFLMNEKLYLDVDGNRRSLDELLYMSQPVAEVLSETDIREKLGKSLVHPKLLSRLSSKIEYVNVYHLLLMEELLENLKSDKLNLIKLYQGIETLSNSEIRGRDDRDKRLSSVAFVLAEDGLFYSPKQVATIQLNFDLLPAFLKDLTGTEKVFLHPQVAHDDQALKQLERCGVEVISDEAVENRVHERLNGIKNKNDCPSSWHYPEDLIRATLFLFSRDDKAIDKFMTDEESLHSPKNTFAIGAPLDWSQLYRAGLLAPGYLPLSHKYLELAGEFDISIEKLNQSLDDIGVHGFHADEDDTLIEHTAYSIAKNRLSSAGHKPEDVHDQTELGYDLKCQGHCSKLFEVKGMALPKDIPLEESEVNAAEDNGENYILVCIYNLPCMPDKIGYREIADPQTIWKAVDKARIPLKSWLMV